jgi:isopenicillin N synthase-like dioxygenase
MAEPDTLDLPIVSLEALVNRVNNPEAFDTECSLAADALRDFGCVAVRDARVNIEDNETFLSMMEKYFEMSDGKRDARPELHYQVGVTPSNVEKARDHCHRLGMYGPDDQPLSPCPPEYDPKWRFFWRIGPKPNSTHFPDLNADPVVPPEFPEWSDVMNMWGDKMLDAVFDLAKMAAIGFSLPEDTFTSRMTGGPHLLAPTGSDFNRFGQLHRVLAGFHYDLNFLTIHGKSRFPGLYVWTRSGKKMSVRIPDGCLLVQAGKQFEYLMGGYVQAGFHEVIVTPATRAVIEARQQTGESLWRVSSTLFSHIQSDQLLQPIGMYANEESNAAYPPILTGQQVKNELDAIKLKN